MMSFLLSLKFFLQIIKNAFTQKKWADYVAIIKITRYICGIKARICFRRIKKNKNEETSGVKNDIRPCVFVGKVLYLPEMRNTKNYMINYGS